MKLVDYAVLMTEPEGTIYQEFGKNGLGTPQVFGGFLGEGRDYVHAELLPSESGMEVFGGNPALLELWQVTNNDFVIYYPGGFGRDGSFDYDRHYLVWEDADRKKIAEWLLDPVRCVAEMNDDPHALIQADWDIRATRHS